MFEIEYKGANCITIATKKATVVIDPKLSIVGAKDMHVKDAIELSTDKRFELASKEARLVIDGPGEYEITDFSIKGIAATRHTDTEKDPKNCTLYKIEVSESRIAIIGNCTDELTEQQLEDIGVVDMAVIPVGGNGYTLDAMSAVKIARQLDVKVVVPVHYQDGALKYEVPQDDVESFLKEFGGDTQHVGKLKVKSASSIPLVPTVFVIARS